MPVAGLLAFALQLAPAQADQARSFVSSLGNNANAPNCTRTAPCRTFQVAHDSTLPSGEISVLDPGSYGSVSVNRNISIVNDGVGEAGILISGGNTGVTINAPGASVTVRGLTIKGIGFGGGDGIVVNAAAAVNVENCTIRNLDGPGVGILVNPNTATALDVTTTAITDNVIAGIVINPSGTAVVSAVVDHVGLYNNGRGLWALSNSLGNGAVAVTVNDSVASNNQIGIEGDSGQTAPTHVYVNRSVASFNPVIGIDAVGAFTQIVVNQSAVLQNGDGWDATSGGHLWTTTTNLVFGNGSNGPTASWPLQ